MRPRILLCLLTGLISLACTSDDEVSGEGARFQEIRGRVSGTVGCHTKTNGLAYEIDVLNNNTIEKIISANLPDQFKEEGLEIIFDMEQSQEGLTFCIAIYDSSIFYKVEEVRSIK